MAPGRDGWPVSAAGPIMSELRFSLTARLVGAFCPLNRMDCGLDGARTENIVKVDSSFHQNRLRPDFFSIGIVAIGVYVQWHPVDSTKR